MNENRFKIKYHGSVGWLIFWFIVFFPVAFVLLLTAVTFQANQKTYTLQYDGSRGWLCFWVVVFFPVAILLLFLNGFSISTENTSHIIETTCCKMPQNPPGDIEPK